MAGVLVETTDGMMFETSIGGKKENCEFAIGQSRCQPICSPAFIVSNSTGASHRRPLSFSRQKRSALQQCQATPWGKLARLLL
jgi:hypothetical protein